MIAHGESNTLTSYATIAAGLLFSAAAWTAPPTQVEVFRAGEGGYHTYRIPAMITTPKGTLLAFCEGRRNSASDTGDIDVVLRRSFDGGKTWAAMQKLADMEDDTIGNPTPVFERKTGTIFLLLTRNPGHTNEKKIVSGTYHDSRTVWIIRSRDDGATWTQPVEITAQTKRPDWTWYATGPGNGIQLRSGRLVIPCDHNRRDDGSRHSHIIYSDDRGETWKIGAVADVQTNESAIAELKDGSLLLNMRSYQRQESPGRPEKHGRRAHPGSAHAGRRADRARVPGQSGLSPAGRKEERRSAAVLEPGRDQAHADDRQAEPGRRPHLARIASDPRRPGGLLVARGAEG